MGAQELIEKAPDGRWRVKGEEPHLPRQERSQAPRNALRRRRRADGGTGTQARDLKPASAHAPWLKNIGCYERKETTIVEGLRYG